MPFGRVSPKRLPPAFHRVGLQRRGWGIGGVDNSSPEKGSVEKGSVEKGSVEKGGDDPQDLGRGQLVRTQRPAQCTSADGLAQAFGVAVQIGTPARVVLGDVDHERGPRPDESQQVGLRPPGAAADARALRFGSSE
jgi:hypothetical protein